VPEKSPSKILSNPSDVLSKVLEVLKISPFSAQKSYSAGESFCYLGAHAKSQKPTTTQREEEGNRNNGHIVCLLAHALQFR
jgi:hypothetical protein